MTFNIVIPSTFSYDGSSYPIGGPVVDEALLRRGGRSPHTRYSYSNKQASVGVFQRTSSFGAVDLKSKLPRFIPGSGLRDNSTSSCSGTVSGGSSGHSTTRSSAYGPTKMADLNMIRGHSPHFSPSRSNLQSDGPELQVHLLNNGFRMIRFGIGTDVRQILSSILTSIAPDQRINPIYYALRLRHTLTQEVVWLSPDMPMLQVVAHILNPACANPDCPQAENSSLLDKFHMLKANASAVHSNSVWRVELRVRYVPPELRTLYDTDPRTCHFYFDQVKQDYIQANVTQMDQETAVQLCCLAIRHYYKEVKEPSDKKNHVEYIEKERGFSNFIPKSVIEASKPKALKKAIQATYKKVYAESEVEYMLRFFELLRPYLSFEQEKFSVTLSTGWNIEIDLIIGPHLGISYLKHAHADPTKVADFKDVVKVQTSTLPNSHPLSSEPDLPTLPNSITGLKTQQSPLPNKKLLKGKLSLIGVGPSSVTAAAVAQATCHCSDIKTQLRIKVANNEDDLSITCGGVKVRISGVYVYDMRIKDNFGAFQVAENIADLIDGYYRLFTAADVSVWDKTAPKTPSGSVTNSLEKNCGKKDMRAGDLDGDEEISRLSRIPVLNEDYSEIGMGEDEADYSTPASE